MAKFEIGKTYYTASICDSECIFEITVKGRTDKTVTVDTNGMRQGLKRVKIHLFDGVESCFALGSYSMAPIFRADKFRTEGA